MSIGQKAGIRLAVLGWDEAREAARQIREQVKRRDYAPDLKLGPGGIREIEFIVQALQLVRGGREPALQVRGTQAALAAFATRGLLSEAVVSSLADAVDRVVTNPSRFCRRCRAPIGHAWRTSLRIDAARYA